MNDVLLLTIIVTIDTLALMTIVTLNINLVLDRLDDIEKRLSTQPTTNPSV